MIKSDSIGRLLLKTCWVVLLALSSIGAGAQSYKILLSNDDGITSPLLAVLKTSLESIPEVTVIVSAPNENQSGSSQSSDGGDLVVDNFELDGEFFGYAVHGKPADAVRFGLATLSEGENFDLVVSGINRGANVGDVSHLSGTVGAAMEGLYQGVPAIAVSQDIADVDTQVTANIVAAIVKRYQQQGAAPQDTLLSINVPGGELKGIQVRPMGDSYLQTGGYTVIEQSEDQTVYSRERTLETSTDITTDTYSYQNGYITVTPLKFDWTDYQLIPEIQSWDLQIIE